MSKAIFQTENFITEVISDEPLGTFANITTAEALFNKQITASSLTQSQNSALFGTEIFTTTIDIPQPFVVVVERPVSITVVEDNEIYLFIADMDIPKNQPVVILDNGRITLALTSTLDHFYRFIGINTADVLAGEQASIKVSGTIVDSGFSWDVNKDIYLHQAGGLTQEPTISALWSQQVANALTPTMLLISHNEPVEMID